jgi:hypothetical protein
LTSCPFIFVAVLNKVKQECLDEVLNFVYVTFFDLIFEEAAIDCLTCSLMKSLVKEFILQEVFVEEVAELQIGDVFNTKYLD